MKMRLKARFNMEFDNGSFIKGKIYKAEKDAEAGFCWVSPEEPLLRQGFFLNEIDKFFIIIKENN